MRHGGGLEAAAGQGALDRDPFQAAGRSGVVSLAVYSQVFSLTAGVVGRWPG